MSFARGPSSLINVAIYLAIASMEQIEDTEFVCYMCITHDGQSLIEIFWDV